MSLPHAEGGLVWVGEGDLDAALIRCRRPEYLRKFPLVRLTERRPQDREPWQSAGFARANKRADVREPGQFGGTVRAMAEAIYELDRCIECGCCVAACGTARMREDFVGAVGINKIARFRLDPRDKRTDEDFYELVGDDSGVFGCMSLLGCHDVCPKELPLQTQIAFIRRKMVRMGMK